MLTFIQNLFGKSKAPGHLRQTKPAAQELGPMISTVEVAHLRLAAIFGRLPEELKPLVLKMPDDTVTVALPVATILKQLPSGAVKVSLATLHRQAPTGVLAPLPPGDKRMVEVPLTEIFRHIKPTAFKRRADQKVSEGLDSKFNLFGDAENPFQIAPTAPRDEDEPDEVEMAPPPLTMPAIARPAMQAPLPVANHDGLRLAHPATPPQTHAATPPPATPAPEAPSPPRILAPPPEYLAPKLSPQPVAAAAQPASPAPQTPALKIAAPAAPAAAPGNPAPAMAVPVEPLAASWPETIRNELVALNGSARVTLPAADVTAGLARGRVTFTWGQIRSWMQPVPSPTAADEATELTLPLKVVAPIFLAATKKPATPAKHTDFDTDIPALFNNAHAPVAAEPAPAAPQAIAFIEPPAELAAEEPAPEQEDKAPETVGELFGQPEKTDWTPTEIVANLAKLPGVAGAVVALQEGLLVAQSLPGDVKSEVIAAFLPQIFGRLNQYASEMKLGEVDDLLFTTHGAHCQIYRLGYLYFAVLGNAGESLPWTELRIVADELARQTQKS